MPNYSANNVVLVRYPFSDLSGTKVRPAVVVNAPHPSRDILIVPLTSKTTSLLPGEFILSDWAASGLHVETSAKRGVYTIDQALVIKRVGQLADADAQQLIQSLRIWLNL